MIARKNKYQSEKDRIRILHLMDAMEDISTTVLHAFLPDISYGTLSGRRADLVNAGLLEKAGRKALYIPHIRSGLGLPASWNPVASKALGTPLHNGEQIPDVYRKTDSWSWLAAYKVLSGEQR